MTGTTYGIRWYKGYFHIHLMWVNALPPHQWLSSRRMFRRHFLTLDRALNYLEKADAVMIFPV